MEAIGALKQRHFNNAFENDDDPLAIFSPEKLVDAAIRSPFSHFDLSTLDGDGAGKKKHSAFSGKKTVFAAWGLLIGFLALISAITFQIHYSLPTPVHEGRNSVTGQPQFSEENVRQVVRYMTRDIGYRVVGTEQEQETKTYLIKELSALQEQARIESLRGAQNLPNFDMWVQVGDGSHRFDFMSKGKSMILIRGAGSERND